jgi:hypothetical protein
MELPSCMPGESLKPPSFSDWSSQYQGSSPRIHTALRSMRINPLRSYSIRQGEDSSEPSSPVLSATTRHAVPLLVTNELFEQEGGQDSMSILSSADTTAHAAASSLRKHVKGMDAEMHMVQTVQRVECAHHVPATAAAACGAVGPVAITAGYLSGNKDNTAVLSGVDDCLPAATPAAHSSQASVLTSAPATPEATMPQSTPNYNCSKQVHQEGAQVPDLPSDLACRSAHKAPEPESASLGNSMNGLESVCVPAVPLATVVVMEEASAAQPCAAVMPGPCASLQQNSIISYEAGPLTALCTDAGKPAPGVASYSTATDAAGTPASALATDMQSSSDDGKDPALLPGLTKVLLEQAPVEDASSQQTPESAPSMTPASSGATGEAGELLIWDSSSGASHMVKRALPSSEQPGVMHNPGAVASTEGTAPGSGPSESDGHSISKQQLQSQPGAWQLPAQQTSWWTKLWAAFVVLASVLALMVPVMYLLWRHNLSQATARLDLMAARPAPTLKSQYTHPPPVLATQQGWAMQASEPATGSHSSDSGMCFPLPRPAANTTAQPSHSHRLHLTAAVSPTMSQAKAWTAPAAEDTSPVHPSASGDDDCSSIQRGVTKEAQGKSYGTCWHKHLPRPSPSGCYVPTFVLTTSCICFPCR